MFAGTAVGVGRIASVRSFEKGVYSLQLLGSNKVQKQMATARVVIDKRERSLARLLRDAEQQTLDVGQRRSDNGDVVSSSDAVASQ